MSRGLFPKEQKEGRQWTKGTEQPLYIDQHILKKSKTRRKNLNMTWIVYKKAYDMVAQNVQDRRQSHKVYRKYHGKLESRTDKRRKKLSWGENPEWDLPGRCTITITICNNGDATESHT